VLGLVLFDQWMLQTNPTRIDLKAEDLREFDDKKKMWPKKAMSSREQNQILPEITPLNEGHRRVRNSRIGVPQKT
jgi:hypothetical protein